MRNFTPPGCPLFAVAGSGRAAVALVASTLAVAACHRASTASSGGATGGDVDGVGRDAGTPSPSARASWEPLPRTEDAALAFIERRTKRRDGATQRDPDVGAREILARGSEVGWGSLPAGDEGVRGWVQGFLDRANAGGRDAYLLFGAFHDSRGQIDFFRRLVGPMGLENLTALSAEPFAARGRWADVEPDLQRGDDAQIAAYVSGGSSSALDELVRRHRWTDYAAWKFGYEPSVLELLVTARALRREGGGGTSFVGCDMPSSAQALLGQVGESERSSLREIHCLSAVLEASPASPRRIAILWGQAHLASRGFRRFLPAEAAVLSMYAFGHRDVQGESTESRLREHVAISDPILVPMNAAGDVAALLLPDSVLGASIDRVREHAPPAKAGQVTVTIPEAGRITLGDRTVNVTPACPRGSTCKTSTVIAASAPASTFAVEVGSLRFAGLARVPEGGELLLEIDPRARSIEWTERLP